MPSKRDYYSILGVERDADDNGLKKAFRKLALEYHPDRNPEPEAIEKFREAQEAYEVLTDPEKRQIYDHLGHEGLSGRFSMSGGGRSMDDVFSGFSSIFEDFFGGSEAAQRGRDLRYRLVVSFREAALGTKKKITIPRKHTCETCKGKRSAPGTEPETCKHCRGAGKVRIQQGFFVISQNCSVCSGEGVLIKKPCKTCHGEGLQKDEVEIEVNIPAGVDTGVRLRLSGEGEVDRRTAKRGDLYVELEVEEDEIFERDGADLYLRVYVPYPIAVLGGEVEVPLLEGTKKISVPKGMTPPTVISLKGEGLADLRSNRHRGQLHIELQVEVPHEPSARVKEILKDLHSELENSDSGKSSKKSGDKKKKKGFFHS
jgi:molecular chaperone DnaJ